MIFPLWKDIEASQREYGGGMRVCLPCHVPNPGLFKAYWRLFTLDSLWQGWEFLAKARWLGKYRAFQVMDRYVAAGWEVWAYPKVRPRWDPAVMPWDLTHPRWHNRAFWAPAFDDDPDPITDEGDR